MKEITSLNTVKELLDSLKNDAGKLDLNNFEFFLEQIKTLVKNREMWMGIASKRKAQLEEVDNENIELKAENKNLKDTLKILMPEWEESKSLKKNKKVKDTVKKSSIKLKKTVAANPEYYIGTVFYEIKTEFPSNSNVDEVYRYYKYHISEEKILKEFPDLKPLLPKLYENFAIVSILPHGRELKLILSVEIKN